MDLDFFGAGTDFVDEVFRGVVELFRERVPNADDRTTAIVAARAIAATEAHREADSFDLCDAERARDDLT